MKPQFEMRIHDGAEEHQRRRLEAGKTRSHREGAHVWTGLSLPEGVHGRCERTKNIFCLLTSGCLSLLCAAVWTKLNPWWSPHLRTPDKTSHAVWDYEPLMDSHCRRMKDGCRTRPLIAEQLHCNSLRWSGSLITSVARAVIVAGCRPLLQRLEVDCKQNGVCQDFLIRTGRWIWLEQTCVFSVYWHLSTALSSASVGEFSPFLLVVVVVLLLFLPFLPLIVPFVLSFPLPVSYSSFSCQSLLAVLPPSTSYSLLILLLLQPPMYIHPFLFFFFCVLLILILLHFMSLFFFCSVSLSFSSFIYYRQLRKTEESSGSEPEQTLISNQPSPSPRCSLLPLAAVHNETHNVTEHTHTHTHSLECPL